jgi:Asparagine synthase
MPAACGALGEFDQDAVARIAARLKTELRRVHADDTSTLLLDREPIRWSGAAERGVSWPERLPERIATARDWRDAAGAGACGLVAMDDGRRGLHASGSGAAPLYVLRDGPALYFSTELDALVASSSAGLRADWSSWASILLLGFVPGNGTPFAGPARVPPQGLVEADTPTPEALPGDLAWRDATLGDERDVPERILTALRAEVEAMGPGPIVCPLSGGFDSRLLACLLAEQRRSDVSTFTVNIDQGNEREEELAAAVAAELGLPHRVVETRSVALGEELAAAAGRVDYESLLHLEMARLAEGLPADGVVVDGLAGDVLIKGLFLDRDVVEAPNSRAASERAFDRLVSAELGEAIFQPETWRSLRASAREAFCAQSERFAGHPSAASLTLYWTRTRRGVATSPTRVLGAERPISMPFLADEVARAALSAPLEAKLGGALYRQVLAQANPAVAALPSSNDALPPAPRTRRPLNRSREARRGYLALLERSPLRPWFSDRLEGAIAAGKLGDLVRSSWLLPRLQYVCAFTLWAERYRDRLAELEPAGPFDGPRSGGSPGAG